MFPKDDLNKNIDSLKISFSNYECKGLRMTYILVLILTSLSWAHTSECEHDATTFRCVKYIKNYDADTITFNIPNTHPLIGEKISVRVRHIDTPEIKGKLPCEKEVARIAKNLIEHKMKNAKNIELKNIERDKYFRILADVVVDGVNLSEVLIKNKLAYSYEGGTKEKLNWCSRLPASK